MIVSHEDVAGFNLEPHVKIRTTLGTLVLGACAGLLGQMSASALPGGDGAAGGIGADVAVCDMPSIYRWGTTSGITGYSIGTTSVNLGDVNLEWYANNNRHPRIPQNLFQWEDGRIKQIGQSWCKDGFCALQLSGCGSCQPAGGGCPQLLGPGCADPYSDSLNGDQGGLAPRSQCNAATGWFQYPPTGLPSAAPTIGRRLQVLQADLVPSSNPGSNYYCDSIYLHGQDAEAGNQNNNASYKRVTVGTLNSSGYRLNTTGSTSIGKPGIYAWEDNSSSVVIRPTDIPNDGRVFVASDVVDNGNGTYRYEYAIYNLTSDYNINGFEVPVPAGANITGIGFHDTDSHSGEPYDTGDWASGVVDGAVVWSTDEYSSNPDANAIRWGTMYNFWFTCDAEPAEGTVVADVFRTNSTVNVPDMIIPGAAANPFDLNDSGCVDGADLGIFVTQWGQPGGFADFNGDGLVTAADLGLLIAAWGCG